MGACESDLVGTDDEHDAVHVGLRTHFLFHLAQPAVEGVEALPQADVVHQQHALTVLVELVTHLNHTQKKKKKKREDDGRKHTLPGVTGRFPTMQLPSDRIQSF